MYEYLSGTLISITDEHAIVDVGGIGYSVRIPRSTREALEGRTRAQLYTALRLRDEQLHLYGFATVEEREIFARVCTISGIGPGTALMILSGIPLDEFRVAVRDGQVKVLERIKGIGRKTAQRLILELREVLVDVTTEAPTWPSIGEDAVGAMIAIGYTLAQAEEAVRAALEDLPANPALEDLVKRATRWVRA